MTVPQITAEERAAAVAKATSVRRERAALLTALKRGEISLPAVLARDDDTVGRLRVQQLIGALPGIGKTRTRQIMNRLGISEFRRVRGLGARQRQRLIDLFPPVPHKDGDRHPHKDGDHRVA